VFRGTGHGVDEPEWNLPLLPGGQAHRRSCHCYTQCYKSWSGSFSAPLGCSRRLQIYCARCLANIYDLDSDAQADEFIAKVNSKGDWECFM